ncbi:MAG: hypothetical protein JSR83_09130 [Proteobacteria bacterium]|nr:hypothetical protein [Pseudomonadota bacterium]
MSKLKLALLAGFFIAGVAGLIYAHNVMKGNPAPTRSTVTAPQEAVVNSAFDGSVPQVERYLKKTLKDPDSFQAIEWGRVQKDAEGYTVRVRYRAKNSFGTPVVNDEVFLLDRSGNVIP